VRSDLVNFVAYLDRVNFGFAKLHMNQALGLSEAAFGLGAGLFFVGYFLFEVPSTGKFSDGSIGRRRHRRNQLAWESLRFRRSLCDGLPEGFDRQLYRGPSIARGLRAGGRHRCRAAADRC
jgi:hypothetical protein